MSGGSFNYLCYKIEDIKSISEQIDSLKKMIDFCIFNEGENQDMSYVIPYLQTKLKMLTSIVEIYDNVWSLDLDIFLLRDIEWAASGDCGIEEIKRPKDYEL